MSTRFVFAVFLGLSVILSQSACKKDDLNEITINIIKPTANQTVADKAAVEIQVEVEASVENHEVEVVVYQHGNEANPVFDWDQHAHDKKITLTETLDFTAFASGTEFHLKVIACKDEECTEDVKKEITFKIP
jgi:anti-sigma regulatory factor (Ser/Thr protein kinase)